MTQKPKVIVVLGPTASGKSDLAVKIALRLRSQPSQSYGGQIRQAHKQFDVNGAEIISADSRQVYKGLDIGTGKVAGKWKATGDMRHGKQIFVYKNIPHHLIDVANPKKVFTVVDYQKLASRALRDIIQRGKIPIICGGTGFYIDALIYNYHLPEVKPNSKLRKKLKNLDMKTLFKMLKHHDPRRAKTIDPKNPRQLIRALEIVLSSHKPVPVLSAKSSTYDILKIGIALPWPKLKKRIKLRLRKRIKSGLLSEVKKLHRQGLSWHRMRELGLEYRYAADFLTGKITTRHDFESQLAHAIQNYAKRQMTWWRKDMTIHRRSNAKEAVALMLRAWL